jgi:hypothetical protein
MNETETRKPAYRDVRGEWEITGYYEGVDNIIVRRDGEVVRTLTVPGYKIWNYSAHFDDLISALSAEPLPLAGETR